MGANIKKSYTKNLRIKPKPQLIKLRNLPDVLSWRAMMECFRTMYDCLERGLISDDWSMSRFQIILLLYFDGPKTQIELSRRFLVTRGNMSAFCKRLIIDGLIAPVKGSQQKRPPLTLMLKGAKMFEEIFPKHIGRIKSTDHILRIDPRLKGNSFNHWKVNANY